MSVSERVAQMMIEASKAAFADVDAWRADGSPEPLVFPISITLRDRLIDEDPDAAYEAYTLLADLLAATIGSRP